MVPLSSLAATPPGATDVIRTSQSLNVCQDVPDTTLHIFDWGEKASWWISSLWPHTVRLAWGTPLWSPGFYPYSCQQLYGKELWQKWLSCSSEGHSFQVTLTHKMLSHAGDDRLQTGMQDALENPQGTVARVHVAKSWRLSTPSFIIRNMKLKTYEELSLWPLAVSRSTFQRNEASPRLKPMNLKAWYLRRVANANGCGVKYIPNHGPVDKCFQCWVLHSTKSY